jgi:hypothetical protein
MKYFEYVIVPVLHHVDSTYLRQNVNVLIKFDGPYQNGILECL